MAWRRDLYVVYQMKVAPIGLVNFGGLWEKGLHSQSLRKAMSYKTLFWQQYDKFTRQIEDAICNNDSPKWHMMTRKLADSG